jgi:hypothetical protein
VKGGGLSPLATGLSGPEEAPEAPYGLIWRAAAGRLSPAGATAAVPKGSAALLGGTFLYVGANTGRAFCTPRGTRVSTAWWAVRSLRDERTTGRFRRYYSMLTGSLSITEP